MRTAISVSVPAALAGVLLLTACGGTEQSGAPASSGCRALPGSGNSDPARLERDGVRIVGLCGDSPSEASYEIANASEETLAYTITFNLTNSAGQAMDVVDRTVSMVGAGETVRRTLDLGAHEGATVSKVRSVPAREATSADEPCPSSGMRVYADEGDAAMGLRVIGLHLENCGKQTITLNGHPELQLLDGERKLITGVKILHGSGGISTGTGFDDPARPVTLKPGEAARSGLLWRNTTEMSEDGPVNVPYVRVLAKPGAAPVIVTPELDLGTTGKLGVSPWKADQGARG
ncbi:DUF4232 domain-containing protein [Streptomyces sp. NBC_01304]|uniref:DUF4232 domain-containing protein n=1 Tax=Streptomyces sp. NBC_01304 TaxID=2903818 RepID=UPI002E13A030|nr:DUF4232 domain-containing protein [Streptomyces sp. NBC_01304]